jgi:peptide methionine sulfoxide reductase MsrA
LAADGSRWSATVFTLAEVERLMKRWSQTDEELGGRCFWCADGLIVRAPGIDDMTQVLAGLLETDDFTQVLQRLDGE